MCSSSGRLGLDDDFAQNVDGAFAAGAVDVAVCDKADGIGSGVERPDAVRLKRFAELDGVEAGGFAIENDDVGLNRSGIDSQAGDLRDFAREKLRVGVVFVEALGGFFEREKPGCGEDSGLAHSAA